MKLTYILLCFIIVLSCSKSEEQASDNMENVEASRKMSPSVSATENEEISSFGTKDSSQMPIEQKLDNALGKVFAPINTTTERLLEYNIQLSYESTDLIKTRKDLLDFITKYGYLESSSAVNARSPYMSARIHIASSKLYEALQDLDKLGILLSEEISSIDHTEGMVWQKRKSTREKLRQVRRNLANSQITAGAKNWQQVEGSISESEDQLDLAEQETWKINDRVKWATIQVNYTTPLPADTIQIPAYKNAFVGLLNLFLEVIYYLIWFLPFAIIFGFVLHYTKSFLKKMRKKDI